VTVSCILASTRLAFLALSLAVYALCLALRCTHTLIHIRLPRTSASFFHPSSDPFPRLFGNRRATWIRQIAPFSVAFALDVHLVFPPPVPRDSPCIVLRHLSLGLCIMRVSPG
jgi:hypothetical protein